MPWYYAAHVSLISLRVEHLKNYLIVSSIKLTRTHLFYLTLFENPTLFKLNFVQKNCHEIFQFNYSGNTIQEFCNFDFIWLIFCFVSVSSPKVTGMTEYLSVSQGGKIKLKCKIAGSPLPKVTWLKDGRPLHHDFHISIKSKRKRSILRLSDAQGRDGGKYTCRATNVLGEQSQTTSISVRVLGNHPFSIIEFSRLKLFLILAPDPPASTCPIEQFCLNGGKCLYYPMIGEHVCR